MAWWFRHRATTFTLATLGTMTLSISDGGRNSIQHNNSTTLTIVTLTIMTLTIVILTILTLTITTFTIMTFIILILSITTLSIIKLSIMTPAYWKIFRVSATDMK
jgi:hypothetical protein